MQTYRWTLTMALSIVHRATGVALYFGTLLLAWWLIAAASGPAAYANVQAFTSQLHRAADRIRLYLGVAASPCSAVSGTSSGTRLRLQGQANAKP